MDQNDELRDELIAIVNAMDEIGPENDDFLVNLYFERKQQLVSRREELRLSRPDSGRPRVVGAVGAFCAIAATVLAIWAIPGVWYEHTGQSYLDPSALQPLYYIALLVAVVVTVYCAGAERKRLRARRGQRSRGRRVSHAGA